jgi:hypothetical protein
VTASGVIHVILSPHVIQSLSKDLGAPELRSFDFAQDDMEPDPLFSN